MSVTTDWHSDGAAKLPALSSALGRLALLSSCLSSQLHAKPRNAAAVRQPNPGRHCPVGGEVRGNRLQNVPNSWWKRSSSLTLRTFRGPPPAEKTLHDVNHIAQKAHIGICF